jgi:type II secretory pathway pseudopilin PulG
VVVALAIMGIGLLVIMQLFAGGLRSVKASEEYTMALIYARQKMEEAALESDPDKLAFSGTIEGTEYTWEAEVEPFPLGDEDDDRYAAIKAYHLKVRVKWPGLLREKYVELSTLKVLPAEITLTPPG